MGKYYRPTVAFCYVHKCELSYMCPGRDKNASNRVCGIWLGICKGANVV